MTRDSNKKVDYRVNYTDPDTQQQLTFRSVDELDGYLYQKRVAAAERKIAPSAGDPNTRVDLPGQPNGSGVYKDPRPSGEDRIAPAAPGSQEPAIAPGARDPGGEPRSIPETAVFSDFEPWAEHYHHLYPQAKEFAKYWKRAGIDIDKYAVKIPEDWHLFLHSTGDIKGVGSGGLWNENWRQFFEKNRRAGRAEIEKQLEIMKKGFGLSGLPVVDYPKRPAR
jgi:hypothetical protein